MKSVAIIGFGRFGRLLAEMACDTFDVTVIESSPAHRELAAELGFRTGTLESVASADLIFLAVPISSFESVLTEIAPHVSADQTVVDFCSVKTYPVELMKRHLPHAQLLGTHPMFGPDSAKKGLAGLQVAFCPVSVSAENLRICREFFEGFGLEVIETTPEAHDADTVYSQAFTYSVARLILNMGLPDITFKTRSYAALTEIAELSANDTAVLFHDLLYYNPNFADMKAQLDAAFQATEATLTAIIEERREDQEAP